MTTDAELLSQYASEHSEAAFTELVRRHVDLVYSAAVRLSGGDTHRAEDVTQQVFAELARQAQRLARHPALTGWLYTTTRQMALRANRTRQRWLAREQEANSMNQLLNSPAPDPGWNELRSVLDEAMHELAEKDRLAVLHRYFQNQTLKEVGASLGLTENGARMRVERALEKLRGRLARKGVTSTAAGLVAILTANAVNAAPSAFVATLSSASIAGASSAGGTFALLKWMTMTKLEAGIFGTVVVASLAIPLVVQQQAHADRRAADASLRQQTSQLAQLQSENERLSNSVAVSQPASANPPEEAQRLRDQVAALRRQTGELTALRAEDQRLRALVDANWKRMGEELHGRSSVDSDELNARSDYCMRLGAGMQTYAARQEGQYPTNLADAFAALPPEYWSRTNFAAYKPDEFEIVYHGSNPPPDKYAHPSDILLIREKRAWKNTDGRWVKSYTMLSGLGNVHSEADGNFEAWENRRIVRPEPSK